MNVMQDFEKQISEQEKSISNEEKEVIGQVMKVVEFLFQSDGNNSQQK